MPENLEQYKRYTVMKVMYKKWYYLFVKYNWKQAVIVLI